MMPNAYSRFVELCYQEDGLEYPAIGRLNQGKPFRASTTKTMQMKLALQKVPSALRSIACKGRTAISKTWWTFPIAFMGLVFWLFYQGYFPIQGGNLEQRGQFGDSFGVLNS